MRSVRRITVLLVVSLMSFALLVACGTSGSTATATPGEVAVAPAEATEIPPTAEPEPVQEEKVLRLRLATDITQLDPAFHPAGADTMTIETINEGLVTYKPGTWDVVNVLAETIEQSEDGLTIDFKLREGVQFHKGYGELTAEDVKFSFERFIDPELDAPYKGDWENLDHVEVTGKYTGVIVLKEPFAPLWVSTLPSTAGVIISKAAMEEKGLEAYATDPIGTGPYEFVEWMPNQRVVLKPFDGYWGETPEWDEIRLIPVPEDSAAEIAVEAGELDFSYIAGTAVDRFDADPGFETIEIVTMNYAGLLMNVQHPLLEDINVRQAIRYGINVPSIITGAYDDKAARACAILAPGQLGYWEDAPCYDQNVETAKDYLAQAGVDSLDLTLTVYNSEEERAVAEIMQANLAEIGINVEIIAQDDATYWDGGFGELGLQERQLTYISWSTTNPDPSWSTVWFNCDQVLQWNWMYWCSEEYDALHYGAITELDPAKRNEMYVDLQQVWDEGVNVVWTIHPTLYFAVRSGLEPGLNPAGIPILAAFHEK